MADVKKLNTGASELYVAVIDWDRKAYFTPVQQVGLTKFEGEPQSKQTNIYADDQVHAKISGNTMDEITVTTIQVDKHFNSYVRGAVYDTNEMYTLTGEQRDVALVHMEKIIDTVTKQVKRRMHIYYNCTLTSRQPKKTNETSDDEVKPVEYEWSFKAKPCDFVLDDTGAPISYLYFDEDENTQAIFDGITSNLYVPKKK